MLLVRFRGDHNLFFLYTISIRRTTLNLREKGGIG